MTPRDLILGVLLIPSLLVLSLGLWYDRRPKALVCLRTWSEIHRCDVVHRGFSRTYPVNPFSERPPWCRPLAYPCQVAERFASDRVERG